MSLGDSITLYPGESYQIPTQSNCLYYTWFPPAGLDYYHIASPVATPQVSTKYIVHGTTEWGCKVVDSISIYVTSESVIDLPNAFTPGSSINKNFKPMIRGMVTITSFTIYNRWGNLVYDGTNPEQGWDGTYKAVPQPFGVYVYSPFARVCACAKGSRGMSFRHH
jgi:gliding motility-associated-like protein